MMCAHPRTLHLQALEAQLCALSALMRGGGGGGPSPSGGGGPLSLSCGNGVCHRVRNLSQIPAAEPLSLVVGTALSLGPRKFTQQDVDAFTQVTGDANPIHTDNNNHNHKAVVPGALLSSLFPATVGAHVAGAVHLSQTSKFREKVLVGDDVEAVATVSYRSGRRAKFDTTCYLLSATGDRDKPVVTGEALCLLPV